MPLYLPRKVAAQPQVPARLDRANTIARGLLFATTPNHGQFDAADARINYIPQVYGTNYVFEPSVGGVGFRPISFSDTFSNTSLAGAVNHTLMVFVSVDANVYPINDVAFNSWGDNNSFGLGLNANGTVYVRAIGAGAYLTTAGFVPLRKVVAVISVVDSGGTTIYIDGKVAATSATGYANNAAGGTAVRPYGFTASSSGVYKPARTYLSAGWGRSLSPAEVLQISQNPWQIFAPSAVTVLGSSITYTYARPSSDVTTQWTPSTAGPHYAMIDEVTYNDADYIYATAAAQTDEVGLQAMSIPTAGTSVLVNYRVQGITGGGSVTVSLYSGATLVKADTTRTANNTSPAYYTMTVTAAEWGAVAVNWSNMRLRFVSA